MANITEIMRAETNKADRALNNLWEKKRQIDLKWQTNVFRLLLFCYADQTAAKQSLEDNTPVEGSWYLRPLENTTNRAANQQAELLGKKYPGNLTKRWVCLTLQIQNCRSKESNAESKAEEDTPVGQCVMGIPFKQSQNLLIHKHLGYNGDRCTWMPILQQLWQVLCMFVVVWWVSLKPLATCSWYCLTEKDVFLS